MVRLDLSWFYKLGVAMNGVRRTGYDQPIANIVGALSQARPWLAILRTDAAVSPALRGSRASLDDLARQIDAILEKDGDAVYTVHDFLGLMESFNRLEAVLTSELAVADAYFVVEKKPYSTLSLIQEGVSLFPPSLLAKVPEASRDLGEAGKCLAFEVPTAAAFHIHRATEAVLRRYWEAVTGNAPKPKARNIGVYLAALKKLNCGDGKVIAALSQMTELHRNPTIHPEDHLSMEEAIALVGIANSVVAAMLKEIPDSQGGQSGFPFPPVHPLAEVGR